MRVISGKYRGKKLKDFNLETTKPTLDRVKESLFNLIQFDIINANVLDLFSGTGALGVEAISRGANLTHMVEINKEAVKIINENLKGVEGNYKVFNVDFKTYLNNVTTKFDIVLLDPPYKTNLGVDAINLLVEKELLNNDAIVLFETSFDNEFEFNNETFEVVTKKYGSVLVYKLIKRN